MRQFAARLIHGLMSRLRPFAFFLRRVRISLASPAVEFTGKRQRVGVGVRLCATDGGRIVIDDDCNLSRGIEVVAQGGRIEMGARVFIGSWTMITSKSSVVIGNDCLIAERVTIRDQDHAIHGNRELPIAQAGFKVAPITIGDGAWIAAGAVVLKGVRIGRGAVVAANAVVTQNVADFEIVAGIPARSIGKREEHDG